jgi:hypothetical protein
VARPIGSGSHAITSYDGKGVWLQQNNGGARCTLTELAFDGKIRTARRPTDCRFEPRADTPLGLLGAVVNPGGSRTGDELVPRQGMKPGRREAQIYGIAGHRMLAGSSRDRTSFILTDENAASRTPLARPTPIGDTDNAWPSPDGRYLLMSFEESAWSGSVQRMDLWLLDVAARQWSQLPSMPTPAILKATATAWTADGHIVLLGEFDGVGQAIAVWRPGDKDLQVRAISLPSPRADAFAVITFVAHPT